MTPDQIRRSWDDDDTPRSVFPEPLAERLTRENKALRAENERLRGELAEYDAILSRQGDLLTRTANALRGQPPELTSWSHHDVPELAQAAVDQVAKVRALAFEHDHCSGCRTPWWLRAVLDKHAGEQAQPQPMDPVEVEARRLCEAYRQSLPAHVSTEAVWADFVFQAKENLTFLPQQSEASDPAQGGGASHD